MAANASVVLVISCEHKRPSELVPPSSAPHNAANVLSNLLMAGAEGTSNLSIDGYSSTAAPVAATGTLTVVYASLTAGDTVTIGSVTLTASASTTDATNFKKFTDGPTTATNLATCINTNTTLNQFLKASAASSVVTVTALEKGVLGNQVSLASSAGGVTTSGSFLASGAGGVTGAATTWRLGL